MKKLIAALLASSVAVAVPVAAFAQAADPAAPAGPSVTAPAPAAPAAGAGDENQYSWTDLLASLNVQAAGGGSTLSAMNDLVAGIGESSNIQLVDVFTLEGAPPESDSASDLQAALEPGDQALGDLHTAITANTVLMMKLEEAGRTASDVVAVNSAADGTFMIYVRPAGTAIDPAAPSAAPDAGAAAPASPTPMAPAAPSAPPASGAGY